MQHMCSQSSALACLFEAELDHYLALDASSQRLHTIQNGIEKERWAVTHGCSHLPTRTT